MVHENFDMGHDQGIQRHLIDFTRSEFSLNMRHQAENVD